MLSVEARSLGAALAFHTPTGFVALTPRSTNTAHVYATGDVPTASGWNAFPDPCASTGGNYALGLASMVAPDTTRLFTLCYGPGHAGSETKLLMETRQGRSAVVGTPPALGDGGLLALSPSGTMLIVTSSGTTELDRSTDGGNSWSTVERLGGGGGASWRDLAFLSASEAVVVSRAFTVTAVPVSSNLLMSDDGGATWHRVPIG
ncbi:MAG: hypothetical protein ACRDXC_00120 [Acidimicrobiales bacterium]